MQAIKYQRRLNQFTSNLVRIRLFHWNAQEAQQKIVVLKSIGYEVDYEPLPLQALQSLKNNPPDIVVIDLSMLPRQGCDIAIDIQRLKSTDKIPIVFVGGTPKQVNQVKTYLPDAIYAGYNQLSEALKAAYTKPTWATTVPKSVFNPYNQTSLFKKLGIKPDTTLTLIDAPEGFINTLQLPQNVTVNQEMTQYTNLVVFFARSKEHLTETMRKITENQPGTKVWVAWKKKAPGMTSNPDEQAVREKGLSLGLVDYKICRINETWTALLFTRRKTKTVVG